MRAETVRRKYFVKSSYMFYWFSNKYNFQSNISSVEIYPFIMYSDSTNACHISVSGKISALAAYVLPITAEAFVWYCL